MDIQRKRVAEPQKNTVPYAPSQHVVPEFTSVSRGSHQIEPKGPYHLGEEQLWYQPPSFPPGSFQEKEEHWPETIIIPQASSSGKKKRKNTQHLPALPLSFKKIFLVFVILLLLGIGYGLIMKNAIQQNMEEGIVNTQKGVDALGQKNFAEAEVSFLSAEKSFSTARAQTLYFPVWLAKPLTFIPGVSKGASGVLAVDASGHLVKAALRATFVVETLVASRVKEGEKVSYLEILESLQVPLADIRDELEAAHSTLGFIPSRDIPEESRLTFEILQKGIPGMTAGIDSLLANIPLVEELLGKNGPRLYLFLFQNNQELRPTGGFIGSYGILEFKDGKARRFFIDGIFNPDGQLKANIIPPKPIQKMSAGWSLHDSNWFPDFPTSAEKAIFFYEKTGGPTVDGVFTLTPFVLERLLALTGPIELPEYEMTVDSKNFIPTIQEQVEVKYDKEENKPKKVLADLASILMERVFALTDPTALYSVADILVSSMNEKQILLYTRNTETQALIETAGWSGKIETAPHDYVSVIHTNINGYKTDGVIDDTVEHEVVVEPDGTLLAKTRVTRKHKGGNTPYDWWNRVNSNYMRVYVPIGSKLVSASGHTREFPPAPLDYKTLGFQEDETVLHEEEAITIDEKSGTRVGVESGKTVFGNWVYVSPGEEVSVEYVYLLPFRIDPTQKEARAYSLLFQKQPGMDKVDFQSQITYPKEWDIYWQSDSQLQAFGESGIQLKRTLRGDAFWGMVFTQ